MKTPALAIPRVPHDVIFAIGGWTEGRPQSCVETYDTRADRWINIPYEDIAGPRGYHGTAVIGNKIYCIGGYDGSRQFNVCREFDAKTKVWQEVNIFKMNLSVRRTMMKLKKWSIYETESTNALLPMLC